MSLQWHLHKATVRLRPDWPIGHGIQPTPAPRQKGQPLREWERKTLEDKLRTRQLGESDKTTWQRLLDEDKIDVELDGGRLSCRGKPLARPV